MADRRRRAHNLLLIRKLLAVRDAASPFTLVLDSVEQSAWPLVRCFVQNAKAAKTDVMFVSYETVRPPADVTVVIQARRREPAEVKGEIERCVAGARHTLLIIDTLYPLSTHSHPSFSLPSFLSSLPSPSTSLLAIYHTDIPLPAPVSPSLYTPAPITLLRYLATAILTTHSFSQCLARTRAAGRSQPEPLFGLGEGKAGVVVGRGANDARGCVVEMEFRRKSGRGVEEWFFLATDGGVGLLGDQEGWRGLDGDEGGKGAVEGGTFELGLTEKQRGEREGVVLPYFDAQKGEGGEGGRILYDLGVEDDFDEEEDEI